jgi:Tol biopolymer transport system component
MTSVLWMSTRAQRSATWSPPQVITELDLGDYAQAPWPSRDGSVLYYTSNLSGPNQVWATRRPAPGMPYSTPTPVPGLGDISSVWLTESELVVYYEVDMGPDREIYYSSRPSVNEPFAAAHQLVELTTPLYEEDPWLSPDLRTLVFSKDTTAGNRDLYIATR